MGRSGLNFYFIEAHSAFRSSMPAEFHLWDSQVSNAVHLYSGKGGGSQGITVFVDYIQLPTPRGTDVLFMLPEIISVLVADRLFMVVDSVVILKRSFFGMVSTMPKS